MARVRTIILMILLAMFAVYASAQPQIANATRTRQPQLLKQRALSEPLLLNARDLARTDAQDRLIREIRHELVTLPYYDVFDWLEGEVRPDGTVVLRGEVVRPSTKKEAEERVKKIEGVERVVNEIDVLPPSPNDDRIRLAIYRALFGGDSPLFRYAHRAVPPIHIIVKNGRVWLKGVVATPLEKQVAYTKASTIPGVFSVINELRVES
jgi:hyperosmotically inducible protein